MSSAIGVVCVESDYSDLYQRSRGYVFLLAVIMAVSSLVAFALSSRLQAVISGPILRLAETARTISTSRAYHVRADGGDHDELGRLVVDFNLMLDQIEQQDRQLRLHGEGFPEAPRICGLCLADLAEPRREHRLLLPRPPFGDKLRAV